MHILRNGMLKTRELWPNNWPAARGKRLHMKECFWHQEVLMELLKSGIYPEIGKVYLMVLKGALK
jgi:hypothetical protein